MLYRWFGCTITITNQLIILLELFLKLSETIKKYIIDNNNVIDKSMYIRLKSHGIEIGASMKNSNSSKNNINIITNVSFVNLEECKNLINGMTKILRTLVNKHG